jgi:hypothetical protein
MAEGLSPRLKKALGVVIEVFPYHELAIRRLIKINEAFREMCLDFSEAQDALGRSPQTLDQPREDYRLEWEEIVARLQADIRDALRTYEAGLPDGR